MEKQKPGQKNIETSKGANKKKKNQNEEQTKLIILVILGACILILGWIATWNWNYKNEEMDGINTIVDKVTEAAAPGAEKLNEGNEILKSQ